MKKLLLLAVILCALSCLSAAAQSTSMDYLILGSAAYSQGDYRASIPPYQKAIDLEKTERKLPKKFWILLIDNLGMAYGITGDVKSSQGVFEYGIKEEPTYPLFYYNIACGYGELRDEDNALKFLEPAFKYRKNMMEGEHFPDPMTDDSFRNFVTHDKFKKAVAAMKKGS